MALLGAQFVNAVSPNPVGSLQAYAGASAPTGWLLCDGTSYTTAAYPELYSVLGYTYGGSGSNFNVPDLRGRVPMGAGTGTGLNASGTGAPTGTAQTARTRGEWGGEETHLNTAAESGMPAHLHTFDRGEWVAAASAGSAAGAWAATKYTTQNTSTASAVNATNRHNNVPPFLVTNYIIKAVADAPRSGLAYGSTPPIVTALPSNPQFGDVVTYIADATNGVAWDLQYDASGTYPWKFIGGPPLNANLYGSSYTTSGASWQSTGVSFSLARSGDYDISVGGYANSANATSVGISPNATGLTAPNGTTGITNSSGFFVNIAANQGASIYGTYRAAGISGTLTLYAQSSVTANVFRPYIMATPIRVA